MYSKGTVTYQPLPLPDQVQRPDAQAMADVQVFHDYMKRWHSVRDFSPRPVQQGVITAAIATVGTAPSGANHQPGISPPSPTLR